MPNKYNTDEDVIRLGWPHNSLGLYKEVWCRGFMETFMDERHLIIRPINAMDDIGQGAGQQVRFFLRKEKPAKANNLFYCWHREATGQNTCIEQCKECRVVKSQNPDEVLIDEIAGVMFKNKSDEADDGCWIDGDDFHKVAKKIVELLKTNR